jgi:hypothetical protein
MSEFRLEIEKIAEKPVDKTFRWGKIQGGFVDFTQWNGFTILGNETSRVHALRTTGSNAWSSMRNPVSTEKRDRRWPPPTVPPQTPRPQRHSMEMAT